MLNPWDLSFRPANRLAKTHTSPTANGPLVFARADCKSPKKTPTSATSFSCSLPSSCSLSASSPSSSSCSPTLSLSAGSPVLNVNLFTANQHHLINAIASDSSNEASSTTTRSSDEQHQQQQHAHSPSLNEYNLNDRKARKKDQNRRAAYNYRRKKMEEKNRIREEEMRLVYSRVCLTGYVEELEGCIMDILENDSRKILDKDEKIISLFCPVCLQPCDNTLKLRGHLNVIHYPQVAAHIGL